MTVGIYQIKRIGTEDVYIGSSANIENRWKSHRRNLINGKHHSPYLQNVVNKYGIDILEFSIIEEAVEQDLLVREQYYIDLLDPVFNYAKIAGSRRGIKQTPEAIEKVRQTHLGRKRPQETKDRISAALKGNTNGKNRVGIKMSDESKEKMRQVKLGKKRGPRSEETKQKISKAQKDKPRPWQRKDVNR
jgi:group I intron endonuclease